MNVKEDTGEQQKSKQPSDLMKDNLGFLTTSGLIIVVVGASGDLAKKKTFPSLLALYSAQLLPNDTVIWGFSRSKLTDDGLKDRIRPFLLKKGHPPKTVEAFLQICRYQAGNSYGDLEAFSAIRDAMKSHEAFSKHEQYNRLFYFAIPPNVFAETGIAIKKTCMQDEAKGWTRMIVEKPFGRDLESFEELNETLSKNFTESHLYRIDHYLGKEMVGQKTKF